MTPQNRQVWSGTGSGALPLEPGDPESVGTHRLLGRIGEGGMGVVYLGLSPSGRKVAVKVIRPEPARDPEFRARFETEVTNAGRVASFCTARVLDHGEADGLPYLITEYIDGPSLADYIEAHGSFPAESLRSLAVGVATALTAIHAVRLVHRDLKPRNVLLAADGPRVIDFGIARALDSEERHTRTGALMGSLGYIAPEQAFEGQDGTAADVFAWGTLIAHAVSGENPFGTGPMPVLAARAHQAKYDLSSVPQDLLPLVTAALDPDPDRRPTAEELLVHLVGEQAPDEAASALIHDEWSPGPVPPAAAPPEPSGDAPPASPAVMRSGGPPDTAPGTAPRPGKRRTWAVAAGAAGATALVMLGVMLVVLFGVDRDSGQGQPAVMPARPPAAAPTPTASPTRKTDQRTRKPPRSPSKSSEEPTTRPSTRPTRKPTATRPTKRWRGIGGLKRMAPYCASLGYEARVNYSDGGRTWWCADSGGNPHRINMQESCKWHYPNRARVRAQQRPYAGTRYEVDWFCQALC
ncbi:serine/threonine-protein kinase [Actinomadura sp. 7K507]|uniref:serine/threonine-protein kinase n=1 Tax=Actinomadura sp. 7K507 TaxID=2530365 RepID=UPI0010468D54|nr:serine/threonine-protein kinase [Actinomadura sp. 7K507]TDC85875.1 serine/threonine protein kinase [Actinomadura sp. 7K507]